MNNLVKLDLLQSTIFVLDDNAINLVLMSKLLTKAGYVNIITSNLSISALQDILALNPDLVILDLNMPIVDGYEVLSQIRDCTAINGYLPVLVFTADASWKARNKALGLGADDFLTKPGEPDEILLRVRNFLALRQYSERLRNQNIELEGRVQERTKSLYEAQVEVVHRLALAGDYRDDDTGEHCYRVGEMAGDIAEELGIDPTTIELIRLAAPLHDIGKVGISDQILNKPARLTDEERAAMELHTEHGASILRDSRSEILQMAYQIAMTHHERWDGSGYPLGLSHEEIPIVGRIVAVADVFDALTHKRPYKEAWSNEAARNEIVQASGSHFDPTIVSSFLTVLESREPHLKAA